jgi:hypothetical protein
MATGGIFTLITNDGKQDKMLMASDLLSQRLANIQAARAANPAITDPTPTLLDIEKTHILFTNAHFKPFAAIGFEYNKTASTSGNTQLGSQVTFSIPQFGDFFHDMVVYVKLNQPVLTTTATNVSDQPLMRWCPWPGERLLQTVQFSVNGNPLDNYQATDMNFHRKLTVQPNKLLGWNRCVGQEEPETGFISQPNWAYSGVNPANITRRIATTTYSGDQTPTGQKPTNVFKEMLIPLLFWCNRDVRLSVPSVAIPYGQRFIILTLAQGNQLVDMVPRGLGDYTAANIGGTLNYTNMLADIQLYINNIFVNPEVHNIFIKRIGFTLIRVHRQQTYSANNATDSILLQNLKWPIETLFVGMQIAAYNSNDPVLNRTYLTKWERFSQITDVVCTTQGWLSGQTTLKNPALPLVASTLNLSAASPALLRLTTNSSWSIGANNFQGIAEGDLITFNLTTGNTTPPVAGTFTAEVSKVQPDGDVSTLGYIEFKQLVSTFTTLLGTTSNVVITVGTTVSVSSTLAAEQSSVVHTVQPTLDCVTIQAHGIPIYNNFISKFYSAYTQYHYGGSNINVSEDAGVLMIPFNLYPGTYQPSGHINVSRAREFYINYTSSVISTGNVGNLVVSASAINFLLISDGSAVLRYST